MEQPNGHILKWLESYTNHTIKIRKLENDDLDEVTFKLENVVEAVRNETHPDDYVAEHSIILKGEGKVLTNGEEVNLPDHIYEIPYDAVINGEQEGNGLLITTDRATYRIHPE